MDKDFKEGRAQKRPLRFSGDAAFINHRHSAKRIEDKAFTAFIAPASDQKWRFAAVASKRIGGAVERNRAKRRLRAAFAEALKKTTKEPRGIILYAKTPVLKIDYQILLNSVTNCLC